VGRRLCRLLCLCRLLLFPFPFLLACTAPWLPGSPFPSSLAVNCRRSPVGRRLCRLLGLCSLLLFPFPFLLASTALWLPGSPFPSSLAVNCRRSPVGRRLCRLVCLCCLLLFPLPFLLASTAPWLPGSPFPSSLAVIVGGHLWAAAFAVSSAFAVFSFFPCPFSLPLPPHPQHRRRAVDAAVRRPRGDAYQVDACRRPRALLVARIPEHRVGSASPSQVLAESAHAPAGDVEHRDADIRVGAQGEGSGQLLVVSQRQRRRATGTRLQQQQRRQRGHTYTVDSAEKPRPLLVPLYVDRRPLC